MENKNKHGLSRHIPEKIKYEIRKNAGFGCVICGYPIIEYEHIEPTFANATMHNSEHMTCLCPTCHRQVTNNIISKKSVLDAKKNPKALQNGYIKDFIYCDMTQEEIHFGKNKAKNSKIILMICGKPLIWFEKPTNIDEPSKLCAIFYDENGKVSMYINRNDFTAFTDNYDIKNIGSKISISSATKNLVTIERNANNPIEITNLDCAYNGASATINKNGIMQLNCFGSIINGSDISIDNAFCVMNVCEIKSQQREDRNTQELILSKGIRILSLNAEPCGFKYNNNIYNISFGLVGKCKNGKVYNLNKEFIGNFIENYILFQNNSYDNGEPIYISDDNEKFKNSGKHKAYDLSFRLFGF